MVLLRETPCLTIHSLVCLCLQPLAVPEASQPKKWGSRVGSISAPTPLSIHPESQIGCAKITVLSPFGRVGWRGRGWAPCRGGGPRWDGWERQGGRWLEQRGVRGCSSTQTASCGVGTVHPAPADPCSGSPMHHLCTWVVVEGVRTLLGFLWWGLLSTCHSASLGPWAALSASHDPGGSQLGGGLIFPFPLPWGCGSTMAVSLRTGVWGQHHGGT